MTYPRGIGVKTFKVVRLFLPSRPVRRPDG